MDFYHIVLVTEEIRNRFPKFWDKNTRAWHSSFLPRENALECRNFYIYAHFLFCIFY